MEFSYFKKVSSSTKPAKKINLRELIEETKNNTFLKKKVAQMRIHYKDKNKQKYDVLKKQLPCFTPAGIFLERKKEIGISEYNQLTILDIDKLSAQKISLSKVKSKVVSISETLMGFVSPSGDGYKILVRVNSDENTHTEATKQVINYYQEKLGVEIDGSGIDITRLCFLSHDKEVYFNEKNRVFKVQTGNTMKNKLKKALEITTSSLEFKEGSRNNFIYLLGCNLNRFGISMAKALELSISKYSLDDFSESEIENTIKSAYDHKDEFGKWKKIKDVEITESNKLSKEEITSLEKEMGLDKLDFQHRDIAMLLIEEYDIEFPSFSQLIQECFKEILGYIDYNPEKYIVEQFCKNPNLDLDELLDHGYPKVKEVTNEIVNNEGLLDGVNTIAIQIAIVRYKIKNLRRVFNKKLNQLINSNEKKYSKLLSSTKRLETLNNQWIGDVEILFKLFKENRN